MNKVIKSEPSEARNRRLFLLAILALFATLFFSLTVGRYKLGFINTLKVIRLKITNQPVPSYLFKDDVVFWLVRLPRLVMTLLVGSVLSVSGTVYQGLFKNPLVSPDILGVSAGASFGAGIAILMFGQSAFIIQGSAFIFGLLAVIIAYQLGRSCRGDTVTTLVLTGIVVSALFTAGLSLIKYTADPYEKLPAIVYWTMGGFSTIVWKDIIMTLPIMTVGMAILFILRWKLDIMALGDEEALSLGVNVNRMRLIYVVNATLIVASSVSVCGTIGWIGLVVPHIARLIIGPGHNQLVFFTAILGAIFMVLMDTIARTISGGEIPVGIIASFVGAPFFGYLLWKQGRS